MIRCSSPVLFLLTLLSCGMVHEPFLFSREVAACPLVAARTACRSAASSSAVASAILRRTRLCTRVAATS